MKKPSSISLLRFIPCSKRFAGKWLPMLAFVWLVSGCNLFHPKDDTAIARAYNNYLYLSDLQHMLPAGISRADSAVIVQRYIDNWIRQQVYLHHAKENLSGDKMDFEKKVRDYENSLIIYAYETELLKYEMDTLVAESQIANYYENNQDDFQLKENIVKVVYLKIPLDAPDVRQVRRLYRSSDPEELEQLEEYAVQNAASYLIDEGSWLLFSELLREVPIRTSNQEVYLRNNRHVELNDEYYRYFLHIMDYKLKGSNSPLAFERDNIRTIILNQRKHRFIEEKRQALFQQAVQSNNFETFF